MSVSYSQYHFVNSYIFTNVFAQSLVWGRKIPWWTAFETGHVSQKTG